MNLSEASQVLGIRREALREIISSGLIIDKTHIYLKAEPIGKDFDISDEAFDAFQAEKDKFNPGRNTPIAVIRELRVEANLRCGICTGDGPLEYHHIIEFSQVNHYDPAKMLAVCSNCHTRINRGEVDHKQQMMHKEKLRSGYGAKVVEIFSNSSPVVVKWDDIAKVISAIDQVWNYDGTDVFIVDPNKPLIMEEKNRLNNMDEEYFKMIKQNHEPYFEKIREFLSNPVNRNIKKHYLCLLEDLRQISLHNSSHRSGIDKFLTQLYGKSAQLDIMQDSRPLLAILISFMYVNCDLGIKS